MDIRVNDELGKGSIPKKKDNTKKLNENMTKKITLPLETVIQLVYKNKDFWKTEPITTSPTTTPTNSLTKITCY